MQNKKNKKLILAVLSAMVLSSSTALAADNDLFNDVPTNHWAYGAVEQLAKDGILTGYTDGSFKGDQTVTRYEMAQMIANARTHMAKASEPDQQLIDQLSSEFRDDLDALGVRVTRLEKKQENVRVTGSIAQKYERATHDGITNEDGSDVSPHWRKEIKLNLDADVPKTPLTFHGTFTTQMDSYEGNGFNTEEANKETWNGGNERPNVMRPETYYVGGPIDKTGLDGKFGAFYTGTQNDFVNHAVMRGFDVSHKDDKNWFSVFTGRLDLKDVDASEVLSSGTTTKTFGKEDADYNNVISEGWTNDGYGDYVKVMHVKASSIPQASNTVKPVNDFIRHGSSSGSTGGYSNSASDQTVTEITPNTGLYSADWDNTSNRKYIGTTMSVTGKTLTKTINRRRTLTGATFGHRFTNHFDAEVGYYGYTSAAYDQERLNIYSLSANQKVGRKGNIFAAYAHGNQGGYNQAWTAEYQFNGGDYMSAEPNHAFGYYLGYRYLAPDALVKTVYEDGAQIGQRGWEGGIAYNFCHNLQGKVKYFRGSSITNPGFDRSKWFSSLTFNF